MIQLLAENLLSGITVRQICHTAKVTTITFYTYYADKYALADEIFADMAEIAENIFEELQKENNQNADPIQGCCNIFDCIIKLFDEEGSLLSVSIKLSDPYLFIALADIIKDKVAVFLKKNNLKPCYSTEMVSGFLCHGVWGFISEGFHQEKSFEAIRTEALRLIRSMMRSEIFLPSCGDASCSSPSCEPSA